jgi:hypothetical protein
MLDFFFRHQRPPAWNHWAEVVWRDAAAPKFIGDMPHTWVGSDYIRSVLDMFAYEREEDGALVIGAGIPEAWVTSEEGVAIRDLHTYHGPVSFAMRGAGDEVGVTIRGAPRAPAILVRSPFDRAIREALVNGEPAEVVDGREVRVTRTPADVVLRY